MVKRTKSLIFKFALIFLLFIIGTLALTGVATYKNQMSVYRTQKLENLQFVAEHLADIMTTGNMEFSFLQEFYIKNKDKFLVPYHFSSLKETLDTYNRLFAEKYPGKILGTTIDFSELDEDVQLAYALYNYEFFLLAFENTCHTFNLAYTYYLIPDEEPEHIFYMFDGIRKKETKNGRDYILLGRKAEVKRSEHPVLWKAWDTGKRPDDFGVWDNDYGHDYSCYYPFSVNGKQLGIIGAEVEVADANREIFRNSLRQMGIMAIILFLSMILLLFCINKFYILRISTLQNGVKSYAENKDPEIAENIKKGVWGEDEIASLGEQVSSMIHDLDVYMHNLLKTTRELYDAKKNAEAMNILANRDALTGIRNKTAYDNEVKRLEKNIANGNARFGICMIDLNFLKHINDTYGHEQGNTAIKKLCRIVCLIFAHSPVFRIGGDEFVVILENSDFDNADSLLTSFKSALYESQKAENEWERVSAAAGIATYDPAIDTGVESVFKRADMTMYENKKHMKAVRTD